ncbi:MAG: response regulator [Verrucomicrobiota bacterium]
MATLSYSKPEEKTRKPTPQYTLLIVDDEEGPRLSLRVVFKDDYNILMAENGVRAIELAKNNKIDAVISDIRMAGMSGIEMLAKLKEIDPRTEVILLTAYETIETARQALRHGACDYLNKPFDIPTIRAAVANAIERHNLSEEMQRNNIKLLELQAQLQNKELQDEISKSRGEIYASIIHDINGPLTIISGFIQIINQRIADASHVEGEALALVKDRLKRMTRQVTNCIEISQRYLSFMRQRSHEHAHVRVNQVLEDLEELLRAHPSSQTHELAVKTLAEDVSLQINGTDLMQILLNLSINAFQASKKPHSVTIGCNVLEQSADLLKIVSGPHDALLNQEHFQTLHPVLEISVQDTGPGISPELITRIFTAFFTTKEPGEGTGLGLSIVQRLLEKTHGLLHLHSVVGEGTIFHLYLPITTSGK